jgi:acetyl-CoA acetyltransferase
VAGEAFIIDAVRSPVGKRNGTLASLRADELSGQVLHALVERVGVDAGAVDDVQMGCVTQLGEQGVNVARVASLTAGWPETVCGATVDRQCGSSMQASTCTRMSTAQSRVASATGRIARVGLVSRRKHYQRPRCTTSSNRRRLSRLSGRSGPSAG